MLKTAITINCSDCKNNTCLIFSDAELENPEYIKEFPAINHNSVCLVDAISNQDGIVNIEISKCINCGMCAYRCIKHRIKMSEIQPILTNKNINKIFQHLNRLKKHDTNFVNLLIRNFLITLGYKAAVLKKGVISIRTDLVSSYFIAEIEFGEDILETPRAILDDVAVLSSRYKIDFSKIKTFIFVDKLPHIRSEIWEVIRDIKKVTNLKIHTVSLFYLFIRVWDRKNFLTDDGVLDFYIDKETTNYRDLIFKKYMPFIKYEDLNQCEELDIMSQSN